MSLSTLRASIASLVAVAVLACFAAPGVVCGPCPQTTELSAGGAGAAAAKEPCEHEAKIACASQCLVVPAATFSAPGPTVMADMSAETFERQGLLGLRLPPSTPPPRPDLISRA